MNAARIEMASALATFAAVQAQLAEAACMVLDFSTDKEIVMNTEAKARRLENNPPADTAFQRDIRARFVAPPGRGELAEREIIDWSSMEGYRAPKEFVDHVSCRRSHV